MQGATNELVDAWSDGRFGFNNEKTLLSYSTDGGATWSAPSVVSEEGDRSVYSAPAISPNGQTVYVVYMAFLQPFQDTTANPRPERGVMRMAAVGSGGAPGPGRPSPAGPTGDARGTSQGRILYNEFLGDYVYAIATNSLRRGRVDRCPPHRRLPGDGRLAAGILRRRPAGVPRAVAARRLPARPSATTTSSAPPPAEPISARQGEGVTPSPSGPGSCYAVAMRCSPPRHARWICKRAAGAPGRPAAEIAKAVRNARTREAAMQASLGEGREHWWCWRC